MYKFICKICCLLFVVFLEAACSKNEVKNQNLASLTLEQIRTEIELPLPSKVRLEHFFWKNPEYNPSWLAMLVMTNQEAALFKKNLIKKKLLNMRRSSSPTDLVSWWTPMKEATQFTYMTSSNAPVTVIISSRKKQVEVFVWWSSP